MVADVSMFAPYFVLIWMQKKIVASPYVSAVKTQMQQMMSVSQV